MKRIFHILAGVGFLCCGCLSHAQNVGTILFGNNSSNLITLLIAQTNAPVANNKGVSAALYWAPENSSAFSLIGSPVPVGVPFPGIFAGGIRAFSRPGQIQVRAWDGGWPSYEQATQYNGTLVGQSPVLTLQTTGDPEADPPLPPPWLAISGLQGFTLTNNVVIQGQVLTCSSNKTVDCESLWSFDEPAASSPCGGQVVSVLSTITNGISPLVLTRTWAATDSCGNSNICSQSVTVVDTTPPAITSLPGPQILQASQSCDAPAPDLAGQVVANDCSGSYTVVQSPAPGTSLPIGTNAVTLTVYDSVYNTTNVVLAVRVDAPPPWILSQPQSTTNMLETSASFVVTATSCSAGVPLYQWYFNGTNTLAEQTNATLAFLSADATNAGEYHVVISDPTGSVTSEVATLTILLPVEPTVAAPTVSVLSTNPFTGVLSVELNSDINPNGSSVKAWFEFGLSLAYGGESSSSTFGASNSPALLSKTLPSLSRGTVYHFRAAASNATGVVVSPNVVFRSPGLYLPGDLSGDGVVDETELNSVLTNYYPSSPWLLITNTAGLGTPNVVFSLTNSTAGSYSVEFSTNLVDWEYLGPATPRFEFMDPEAANAPLRWYRLRWP